MTFSAQPQPHDSDDQLHDELHWNRTLDGISLTAGTIAFAVVAGLLLYAVALAAIVEVINW